MDNPNQDENEMILAMHKAVTAYESPKYTENELIEALQRQINDEEAFLLPPERNKP